MQVVVMRFIFLAIGFLALLQPAHAQRERDRGWELLGEKTVGFKVDRDVINIGQSEDWFRDRSYRSLRFQAERSDIYMMAVRLVYINGFVEDLRINRPIRSGNQIVVDLPGERSYLRQIEMTYRSRPSFGGQAIVKVYGEPFRRSQTGPVADGGSTQEILLGQKRIGFQVDQDTIRIGQGEDWFRDRSFKSLRFHADDNDVYMIAIRLVYINGYIETFKVDRSIRVGSNLRVDLRGDRSYLSEIQMTYRSRPQFAGGAVVRVYGEAGRSRNRGQR